MVQLPLGTELVGNLVSTPAVLSSIPTQQNNTAQLKAAIPDLFPASAVTHSMSCASSPNPPQDVTVCTAAEPIRQDHPDLCLVYCF